MLTNLQTASLSKLALGAIATVAAFIVALGFSASANAASLSNGNFETGSLSGWKSKSTDKEDGRWMIHEKGEDGPNDILQNFYNPKNTYQAVGAQPYGESGMILYRDIKLPPKAQLKSATLSFSYAYRNFTTSWAVTDSLKDVYGEDANQQFRIDLLKASGDPWTFADSKVLKTVVKPKSFSPFKQKHKTKKVNLTKYAGQKVRIRFGVAVNMSPLLLGVDNVKLRIKTK